MEKTALITGITGQDGSYLAAHLIALGYHVHGTSRNSASAPPRHSALGIEHKITLHTTDITNLDDVTDLIRSITPTVIYHLAAQSSVTESFTDPFDTFYSNYVSTLTLLEAVHCTDNTIRFFHASSCEIFTPSAPQPLTLTSPKQPTSPYGLSKLSAHLLVEYYREKFGLFAVNGILFPHESPLRQSQSFITQLIHHAYTKQPFSITTKDIERDFGDAAEYVVAIRRSLEQTVARDYIIASGQAYNMADIITYIYNSLHAPTSLITINANPSHNYAACIYGDSTHTQTQLDWKPIRTIYNVIDDMIAARLQQSTDALV